MRPFFVIASEARKLPRLALLLLCMAYVIPGFINRDPWRHDDAASFGVTLSMLRGNWQDWLLPNVSGSSFIEEGPLYFWISAIAIRAIPFLDSHFTMRLLGALLLGATLVCVWYATYNIANRPEAQPADPFGLSANRKDFGRTVADIAVLAMISSFAMIVRAHETTTEVFQLLLVGLFLLGSSYALLSPRRGGVIAGMAIGGSLLAKGPVIAAALLVSLVLLPLTIRHYRLVAQRFLTYALITAVAFSSIWPLLLWLTDAPGAANHLQSWIQASAPSLKNPTEIFSSALYLLKSFSWYLWPLWPITMWTLIRWKGALDRPALALPMIVATVMAATIILCGQGNESHLMQLVVPLSLFAAVGLPTLGKSVINLLDWFAVILFTSFGLLIWVYHLALVTGYPERMARSAQRFSAGFDAQFNAITIGFALMASVAWIALVVWRLSARPKPLWRSIVLSGSGMALVWSLLMTLWLPVFNYRKTYRDVASSIAQIIPQDHRCVQTAGLLDSQRASFSYFARVRFAEQRNAATPCDWFLIADRNNKPLPAADGLQWNLVWEGRRIADRQERFRLYSRGGSQTQVAQIQRP
jgi:4-amino-4-deoxy-L-arabinose transferase-like glycosyltransferase